MYLLRLFGAPVLSGPGGPLTGRAAQRHPLALLALLACDPSHTVGREKLLGLLWPESDTESGRRLLNVAVHALRKALGESAIQTVGGSLRLDAARVRSDVRAFADALAAGDPERAAEAYAGPFLDGFFLDADGFDRWAEAERARRAAMLAEALETLASAAETADDPVRAAAWWKRRAAHDPGDSRVALRLMEAMAAAGDRAGAVRHAAVHAALLRDELGAAPDPRIEEAAARLRSAPAVGPVAAAPAGAVEGRRSGDTATETPSPAPPIPSAAADAGKALAPKPRIVIQPARRARRGRTSGRRAGMVLLLSGALTVAAAAGAVSKLGRPYAGAEAKPAVEHDGPALDPAAHAIYLRGRDAAATGSSDGLRAALAHYREALRRDPELAPAYVGMADVYARMASAEHGLMTHAEAYREAEAAARRAVELAPASAEARAALAGAFVGQGKRWLDTDFEFRRAIELDPAAVGTYHAWSLGLLAFGYTGEARDAIRMARLLAPRSPAASAELGRQLYYARDFREAAAELRRAAALDPGMAAPHLGLGLVHLQADSPDAALREFARAELLAGDGDPLALALALQAHAHVRLGRRHEAEALMARMEAAARAGRYVSPAYFAIAQVGLGEHDEAVRLLERALAERPTLAPMLRHDPVLDPLRRTPRFQRLLNTAAP